MKTPHVWPYLFLAHQRLVESQYQRVIDLCRSGIERAKNEGDLSRFFEWSAIARYELGDPDETVRKLFDAAVSLAPLNIQTRRNRENFERFAQAHHEGHCPKLEAPPAPAPRDAIRALIPRQAA